MKVDYWIRHYCVLITIMNAKTAYMPDLPIDICVCREKSRYGIKKLQNRHLSNKKNRANQF